MPKVRLQSLAIRFAIETESILRRFATLCPSGHKQCEDSHLWCQEMCIVRLADAWSRFCRELVLVSASEEPLMAVGGRVPRAPGIADRRGALTVLRSVYTRFPHEPRWIDTQSCLRAANILGIANYATVSAGLAVTPSPVDDLRDVRNFLAHRNEGTAAAVRAVATNVGIAPSSKALGILNDLWPGASKTVLQTWTTHMLAMSQIAAR